MRPSKKASAERVAADQRLRLQRAMADVVARRGFQAARVDEVVALAGVSTATLYKQFGGKLDCFLATAERIVAERIERIATACRDGEREQRGRLAGLARAFDQFEAEVSERPAESRVALVEVLAVGQAALAPIERGEAAFEQMIAAGLDQVDDGPALPELLVKAVVHGAWYVTRMRLAEERQREMAGLGAQLLDWLLCYRQPALARLASLEASTPVEAPQGAVTAAQASGHGQSEAQRRMAVLEATARVAASHGYGALSMARICDAGGVSLTQLTSMFDGPAECFLASVEMLSARAFAGAFANARRHCGDWPVSVCLVVDALYRSIAEDELLARCGFIEIFGAGRAGALRRGVVVAGFAQVLARYAPATQRPATPVAQAVAGGVWGIAHHHVLHGEVEKLPGCTVLACYLTLAPIIGADDAVDAIERWNEHAAAGPS